MTKRVGLAFWLLLIFACCPVFAGEDRAEVKPPVKVEGAWQVSWTGRLGTEKDVLKLKQEGQRITGTFEGQHGNSPLDGKIEGNNLSFDVHFPGQRPYTIAFTGTVADDKIKGTSQAKNVGANGAFLGHGGEVVQPEHPWAATRIVDQPAKSE